MINGIYTSSTRQFKRAIYHTALSGTVMHDSNLAVFSAVYAEECCASTTPNMIRRSGMIRNNIPGPAVTWRTSVRYNGASELALPSAARAGGVGCAVAKINRRRAVRCARAHSPFARAGAARVEPRMNCRRVWLRLSVRFKARLLRSRRALCWTVPAPDPPSTTATRCAPLRSYELCAMRYSTMAQPYRARHAFSFSGVILRSF